MYFKKSHCCAQNALTLSHDYTEQRPQWLAVSCTMAPLHAELPSAPVTLDSPDLHVALPSPSSDPYSNVDFSSVASSLTTLVNRFPPTSLTPLSLLYFSLLLLPLFSILHTFHIFTFWCPRLPLEYRLHFFCLYMFIVVSTVPRIVLDL